MARCVAVTGHRDLGGYGPAIRDRLLRFALVQLDMIHPDSVLTGMAIGWDQAVAQACSLRKIPFVACVPFRDQDAVWPDEAKIRHRSLLRRASEVVVVSAGDYTRYKMQLRNEYMVNALGDDDFLLALYDGSAGGTRNCVEYAERAGKTVRNVWDQWKGFV